MVFSVSMAFVWLIIAIATAVLELATQGLVTIWFAIGALVACIIALFDAPLPVQIVVFIVVSVGVLIAVRPLANKYLNNKIEKTNIDALIGRRLIVKTDIDNVHGTGKVDMDGSTWLAASEDDNFVIKAGEEVEIVKIVGAKLIVKKCF